LTMQPGEVTEPISYQGRIFVLRRGEDVPKSFEDARKELEVSFATVVPTALPPSSRKKYPKVSNKTRTWRKPPPNSPRRQICRPRK
jgi:hypothetical protein